MPDPQSDSNTVSFQRAVSIEFIRNSGGFAVKAPRGQKNPSKGWDPRMNTAAKSVQLLAELERTEDNIGIHLHGNVVDIDVDGKDAERYLIPALDRFLPSCAHVWGRASRPRTHRVYLLRQDADGTFDPASHAVLGRIKRIPEVKVEMRGGPVSRGEYSLLPSSIHPSGETYEWADLARARSTASVATVAALLKGIRLAGAVAVIAPHWQEGMRQDLTMALAGFLHRAKAISESFGEDTFRLDEDDALSFLQALLELVEDDSKDRYARKKAFEATWAKAERGVPVTGATRIGEITGDATLVRKLYTLLTENPDVAAIDEFIARFAIWKGPALAVDLQAAANGHSRPFMSRQNFASSYGHKFVEVNGSRRLLPEMLWSMGSATRIDGMTFTPGAEQIVSDRDGDKLNIWSGYEIPPFEGEVTDEDVAPFLKYVRNIVCRDDPVVCHWVLSWLADIFQNPANKCGTALVLVGLQGAGKSIIGHKILGPIIGRHHYVVTTGVDNVVRNFNAAYAYKLLIQCDEAMNNRQRLVANKLKGFITDPVQQVEPKGVDPYHVPNHSRLLFTSNDVEDAVYLNSGSDDRRYTILEVSPDKATSVEDYWIPLVDWLESEGVLAKIHKWLSKYKYERKTITRPLMSEAKMLMQQSSWDPFDSWLAAMVSRSHPLSDRTHRSDYHAYITFEEKVIDRGRWPKWVNATALADDFRDHVRSNRLRDAAALNETHIRQGLIKRRLIAKEDVGVSQRVTCTVFDERDGTTKSFQPRNYSFPPEEKLKEYLFVKYGFNSEAKASTEAPANSEDRFSEI